MNTHTYRQRQLLPLIVVDQSVIAVGPASILRQGATHAVSLWTDAWRGHETTRGRRQHLQIPITSPDGRLSRHLRREGARRVRQRRIGGVQGAAGAAVLMCAHGAAHDVPSAQCGESAGPVDPCHEPRARRRVLQIGWSHTQLTSVCDQALIRPRERRHRECQGSTALGEFVSSFCSGIIWLRFRLSLCTLQPSRAMGWAGEPMGPYRKNGSIKIPWLE